MSQFAVDPQTGALLRENGAFVRISGVQEVRQHLAIRWRLIRGEVPWDLSRGMRYFGSAPAIFADGTPIELIENEFQQAALGTPGIVQVSDLRATYDRATRHATIAIDATVELDDLRRRAPLHDSIAVEFVGASG